MLVDQALQRFMEGDIVTVALPCGAREIWHVRFAQLSPPVCHCQRLPVGTFPGHVAWFPQEALSPLPITWEVASFEEQDRWFERAGLSSQLAARRVPPELRFVLPEERAVLHAVRAAR
jgi:hypothetical protein